LGDIEIREDVGFLDLQLSQNRHPERSASQMDRVPQRLAARSRRTPTLLICPCCSGLFNHRSPSPYLRVEFEVTKTFEPQSLGKKQRQSRWREKKLNLMRTSSRVHRPYTDWVMEDDHNPSGFGG
jgi:hypothetical protein